MGLGRRLAEQPAAQNQPTLPHSGIDGEEPDLVQAIPDRAPPVIVEEQVVALGDHQRHVSRNRHSAANRLLDPPVEHRSINRGVARTPQPVKQRDVAVDVGGVRRTLTVSGPNLANSESPR